MGAVGVGLLVPFVVRRITEPAHRHLLLAAMGAGAVFVGTADLAARLVLEPIEILVGLVTAAIGGPVFLWLLTRPQDV